MKKGNDRIFVLNKQIRKLIRYYVIWTVIYLPITIYGFVQSGDGIVKSMALFFRNVIFQGENYYSWPLWFLLSSIYGFMVYKFISKKERRFELYGIVTICIAITLQYSVDYIMAMPVSENRLFGTAFVLIEKTIGKGRIFSGTYYILLGMLIAERKMLGKIKIILSVLIGSFFAVELLNLSPMKIIMSVMFFMLVLRCNCSGYGRRFRRTSTVMYYMHMIFLFILNILCKQSMYGFIGFGFCCFMTNILAYMLNTNEYCKNNKAVNLLFGSL